MTDYTYLSSQIKIDIWLSGYKLGLSIIQVGTYAICCKDCDCYQHVYNCLKCLLEWFSKIFWWQTGEQNWLLNSTVCMCAQHYKYCLMPWLETICLQGHWKQSADGQVQFNVGGKDVNNLCAIWTYLFLAVGALSLHFSFKLGVTLTLLSCLARNLKFDKILRKHLWFSATSFSSLYCYELYHRLKRP